MSERKLSERMRLAKSTTENALKKDPQDQNVNWIDTRLEIWIPEVTELEVETQKLREQVEGWENFADSQHILWRAEDIKRFAEIDSRPVTEAEREDARRCLNLYNMMKPKVKHDG